jgi:hypothetical protein
MSRLEQTCCNRNLLELRLNRCWGPTPALMRVGPALVLLLGNSGPTIARKVKVIFDPAPLISACLDIAWTLGADRNAVDWVAQNTHRRRDR